MSSVDMGVDQLKQLRESLDKLWCAGEVVLFTWMNFLQNDLIDSLSITSPLCVNAVTLTVVIDHDNAIYRQVSTVTKTILAVD